MISCREVTEQANDHIERQLPLWARVQFRLHLLACSHCRAYLDQLRKTIEFVSNIKLGIMSIDDEDEIVKAIMLKNDRNNRLNTDF